MTKPYSQIDDNGRLMTKTSPIKVEETTHLTRLILVLSEDLRPTPIQQLAAAAEVLSMNREPWWRWTCHLAAALVARKFGVEPQ